MSKVIKLSGKFHTVGAESAPFTPTHDRAGSGLDAGPGSSWGRDRYEVWSRLADPACGSWMSQGSHATYEGAASAIELFSGSRDAVAAFVGRHTHIYRIVRARGTCEVVA